MNRSKWVAFGLALLLPSLASAAIPQRFSVQGVLRDNMGKLQSMPANITVKLFDAQTGGNQLGATFTQNNVMVQNGLFSVILTVDAATKTALQGVMTSPWLEVTAGADTFSRQPVTPELYALVCDTALNLAGSFAGDVTGTQGATKVSAIQGVTVSTTAPTAGQVLQFDGSNWTPAFSSGAAAAGGYVGNGGGNHRPDTNGTVAHLSFNAPSAGVVTVIATYGLGVRNNGVRCDVSTQLRSAAGAPDPGLPYFWNEFLGNGYNTFDTVSTGYEARPHTLVGSFGVSAGSNTVYLSASSGASGVICPDWLFTQVGMVATFSPTNMGTAFGAP